MPNVDELQKKLKAMADTVNSFKSEAVQLRVIEALLSQLGIEPSEGSQNPESTRPPKRSRRLRKGASVSATATAEPAVKGKRKVARGIARGSGSPGAYAMINDLLAANFFKSPKTIGTIVDHCRTARGHHYKANECSPALLRLLRDGKLQRQKNKDGQYEYTQT